MNIQDFIDISVQSVSFEQNPTMARVFWYQNLDNNLNLIRACGKIHDYLIGFGGEFIGIVKVKATEKDDWSEYRVMIR